MTFDTSLPMSKQMVEVNGINERLLEVCGTVIMQKTPALYLWKALASWSGVGLSSHIWTDRAQAPPTEDVGSHYGSHYGD